MDVTEIPIDRLREAPWNPNRMDESMIGRLKESITRYGVVENLVVRPLDDGTYEVIGGNQRLQMLRDMGATEVPCVVVDLNDAQARLLAQALNRVEGADDLGMKAELIREVLKEVPQAEVLALLPETSKSLAALTSLGQEDIAAHLQQWQKAQSARLKNINFKVTNCQLQPVEEALKRALDLSKTEDGNPNRRGNALVSICQAYLTLTEEAS